MQIFALKQKIRQSLPSPLLDMLLRLKYAGHKLSNHGIYSSVVENRHGLEIGGPSTLFKTVLPLYQGAASLDGVNFSNQTVWEGRLQEGQNFSYITKKTGRQFIAEATNLHAIPDGRYDFLLSSNCLEHVANPLKALAEWKRVLQPGGALILVLPNKDSNFDHKRPVTRFEHLVTDFENNIDERDLSHLDEILSLHDLSRDPPAGDFESFKQRCLKNFENRTLHHHVFDLNLIQQMLEHAGFEVLCTDTTPEDFYALATKRATAA